MAERLTSGELVDRVVDDATFTPWDDDVVSADPLGFTDTRPYTERLDDARADAGTSEAVVTGAATIDGRPVALVVGEFGFLAGTQGLAVGERVTRAFERAAAEGRTVVGMPASGGTRMQEGTLAFVQMLKIASTVARCRAAGHRYVGWLRHPSTGGVLASWGSLAQTTWAEPEALIALTGPRVVELVEGEALPEHVVRAEHLARCGVLDGIVGPDGLRDHLVGVLRTSGPARARPIGLPTGPARRWKLDGDGEGRPDAWEAVERSREAGRPGVRELLATADAVVPLGGVGAGGHDDGCVAALCRWRDLSVVVVGHDRPSSGRGARLDAVGYRTGRRAMRLAAELGLPLVTVVDTQGAASTVDAEEGGIAREIAMSMATMSLLPVPTVALLLGEGSGGGAIAWLAADRVVAAEHAWLTPIAPEGASAILFRSTDRAADLARAQAADVVSLRRIGLIDQIVAEDQRWMPTVAATVADHLRDLQRQDPDARLAARHGRLRTLAAD